VNELKAIGLVFVAVLMSGCSINTAKLHTGLSQEEFDGRVREAFCIGMPLDEAEGVAKGLGLRMKCRDRFVEDFVCISDLYPRGVYGGSILGIGGPKWISKLTLHFGDDLLLDSITRHKTPAPSSGILVRMGPPYKIPLNDCDQNTEGQP